MPTFAQQKSRRKPKQLPSARKGARLLASHLALGLLDEALPSATSSTVRKPRFMAISGQYTLRGISAGQANVQTNFCAVRSHRRYVNALDYFINQVRGDGLRGRYRAHQRKHPADGIHTLIHLVRFVLLFGKPCNAFLQLSNLWTKLRIESDKILIGNLPVRIICKELGAPLLELFQLPSALPE